MTVGEDVETDALRAALERGLTVAEVHQVARRLGTADLGLPTLRLGIVSTCTMDFARSFLIVEGARQGFALQPFFGPFGQVEQQISDPGSPLHAFQPDALLIMLRPEDVAPEVLVRPFAAAGLRVAEVLGNLVERIGAAVERFRAISTKPVLVANFADALMSPLGPFEANSHQSLDAAIAAANVQLRARVTGIPAVTIWDLAGLVRRVGLDRWLDRRLWALARVPVAAPHQPVLAAHLVRTLRATQRPPAKCLVLDLDNTIWGGVIGDDGIGGIKLGDEYPGSVFKDFQRRVLALSDRGILLAVVSKNDALVAEEVFQRHPEMLIQWTDIAASRINWGPKSANLREIAKELNIGSDQLVFFDDNPVERAEVAVNAPEVLVAPVPTDPLEYAQCLAAMPWFDQVTISDEDRKRVALYQERRARIDAERKAGSIDEFLADLQMTAEVGVLDGLSLDRVAQLIGKTNQFNVTTRRHGVAELSTMMSDPDRVVAWIRVADRFGDQGLVGIAIIVREGDVGSIDTFLMSCRVMNRRVEHALLSFASERARMIGCRRLIGEYIPTAKNGMVRGLFPQFGFTPLGGEGHLFELSVAEAPTAWPSVIRRIAKE